MIKFYNRCVAPCSGGEQKTKNEGSLRFGAWGVPEVGLRGYRSEEKTATYMLNENHGSI